MMEEGVIDLATLPGTFELQSTVESGQSYLWNRDDERMYETEGATGSQAWYWTTVREDGNPAVIRVRQQADSLEWEATVDADPHLRRLLRLDDDLLAIRNTAPDDEVVQSAYDTFWGMRLVKDPPFGSLISFICSAQMRVARIHSMQQALRGAFGESVELNGRTYNAYPTPTALAETTEERLRELGLGYRAPYVQRTAEMVASGEAYPEEAVGQPYEEARESLTRFVGVGDKVADCVLLFSLGYLEAVPLDTWIQTTIAEYYPDCDKGNYTDTSRAIRAALGGDYAGYTQTYLFHYLRTGSNEG